MKNENHTNETRRIPLGSICPATGVELPEIDSQEVEKAARRVVHPKSDSASLAEIVLTTDDRAKIGDILRIDCGGRREHYTLTSGGVERAKWLKLEAPIFWLKIIAHRSRFWSYRHLAIGYLQHGDGKLDPVVVVVAHTLTFDKTQILGTLAAIFEAERDTVEIPNEEDGGSTTWKLFDIGPEWGWRWIPKEWW